ncbi:MAG: Aminomethyltransferase [Chlamydiae bacterium]|nr:Aminomethyltransferase [Chlamydiota bacterium]
MKTFFYDEHLRLGAKIVDFAGWQMPITYESAVKEHLWVRENAGLFDISHMAKIWVEGEKSEAFLNYLATNHVDKLVDGKAQYTVLCDEEGMAVDDVIIYRVTCEKYFVVVNASNRKKDFNHFIKYGKPFDVKITADFEGQAIIALQGPQSEKILSKYMVGLDALGFMGFKELSYQGDSIIVARTGYTGEKGYELYGEEKALLDLWKNILDQDNDVVKPIGLAARDSLRLEMGFALYGHELSDQISPVESLAAWVVKSKEVDFLGKAALGKLKKLENKRSQRAVIFDENAIARPPVDVLINGEKRGVVTSGGFSPTLKRSIAIVMVNGILNESDKVSVLIRNREVTAKVVKLPFIKQL